MELIKNLDNSGKPAVKPHTLDEKERTSDLKSQVPKMNLIEENQPLNDEPCTTKVITKYRGNLKDKLQQEKEQMKKLELAK